MSVDLSLIIPNKCRSLRDCDEAKQCFYDTIDHIIKYFHGRKQFVTNIYIKEEDDDDEFNLIEYSFEIPLLNITAYMHAGFWDIWPVARYSQYFYTYDKDMYGKPRIWTREVCFNTLLAFGHKEGWICDEFHSWNSELDDVDSTFEDWKSYGSKSEDGIIHEFNVMDFTDFCPEEQKWPEYFSKYHDDYKECHAVWDALGLKFPQYEFLAKIIPLPNHYLVAQGDDLYILDIESGKLLIDFPIDNCHADFNGAGVQIFRGEKSAFFSIEGKQLTDFRVGKFSWKWATCPKHFLGQIITDEATGKMFLNDGTPYNETSDNKE